MQPKTHSRASKSCMPIALKFCRSFRCRTTLRRHRKNLQVRPSRKRKIAPHKQKSNEFGAKILRILFVNNATNAKVKHYASLGNTRKNSRFLPIFKQKRAYLSWIRKILVQYEKYSYRKTTKKALKNCSRSNSLDEQKCQKPPKSGKNPEFLIFSS